MDSKNSFDEKTMLDNNLSNRYIDLDPNGYFIIKVDLEENNIILEIFIIFLVTIIIHLASLNLTVKSII